MYPFLRWSWTIPVCVCAALLPPRFALADLSFHSGFGHVEALAVDVFGGPHTASGPSATIRAEAFFRDPFVAGCECVRSEAELAWDFTRTASSVRALIASEGNLAPGRAEGRGTWRFSVFDRPEIFTATLESGSLWNLQAPGRLSLFDETLGITLVQLATPQPFSMLRSGILLPGHTYTLDVAFEAAFPGVLGHGAFTIFKTEPVPVPAAALLVAVGLPGAVCLRRRRRPASAGGSHAPAGTTNGRASPT